MFEFGREEEFTSGVVKKVLNMKSIICVLLLPLIVAGWGQKYEKIRLRDVQVCHLDSYLKLSLHEHISGVDTKGR